MHVTPSDNKPACSEVFLQTVTDDEGTAASNAEVAKSINKAVVCGLPCRATLN